MTRLMGESSKLNKIKNLQITYIYISKVSVLIKYVYG
jgi:hypothetical protein